MYSQRRRRAALLVTALLLPLATYGPAHAATRATQGSRAVTSVGALALRGTYNVESTVPNGSTGIIHATFRNTTATKSVAIRAVLDRPALYDDARDVLAFRGANEDYDCYAAPGATCTINLGYSSEGTDPEDVVFIAGASTNNSSLDLRESRLDVTVDRGLIGDNPADHVNAITIAYACPTGRGTVITGVSSATSDNRVLVSIRTKAGTRYQAISHMNYADCDGARHVDQVTLEQLSSSGSRPLVSLSEVTVTVPGKTLTFKRRLHSH